MCFLFRTGVQTFRREHDRFWVAAAHPTLNLFAAGMFMELQSNQVKLSSKILLMNLSFESWIRR